MGFGFWLGCFGGGSFSVFLECEVCVKFRWFEKLFEDEFDICFKDENCLESWFVLFGRFFMREFWCDKGVVIVWDLYCLCVSKFSINELVVVGIENILFSVFVVVKLKVLLGKEENGVLRLVLYMIGFLEKGVFVCIKDIEVRFFGRVLFVWFVLKVGLLFLDIFINKCLILKELVKWLVLLDIFFLDFVWKFLVYVIGELKFRDLFVFWFNWCKKLFGKMFDGEFLVILLFNFELFILLMGYFLL